MNPMIQWYAEKIENCGYKILVGNRVINTRCKKLACPRCGGQNHFIHRSRMNSVERRIEDMSINYSRQLVFTVPFDLRTEYFMTRDSLNRLFKIVKRNIEKYFGELVRVKDQKKGKYIYRLDKRVFATMHLFGDNPTYHPHINVVIFEEDASWNTLFIREDMLKAIRKSYQKALSSLLKKRIDEVVVHYQYKADSFSVKNGLWYVTQPFTPNLFQEIEISEDEELLYFLTVELKNFHFVRFWGNLANCKYRLYLNQRRAA